MNSPKQLQKIETKIDQSNETSETNNENIQLHVNNVTEQQKTKSPIKSDDLATQPREYKHKSMFDPAYDKLRQEIHKLTIERDNALDAKHKTELECRDLYQKWNHRLSQEAKQFATIESEVSANAKDLHLLKVELLQQLETAYSNKYNWLNDQFVKHRNLYHQTVQELNALQQSNVLSAARSDTRIEENKLAYEAQIEAMRKRINDLNDIISKYESRHDEKIKLSALEREIYDHKIQTDSLSQQLASCEEEKSNLICKLESMKAEVIQVTKRCETKLKIKQREIESINSKKLDIEQELQFQKKSNLTTQTEFESLQKKYNETVIALHSKQNQLSSLHAKCATLKEASHINQSTTISQLKQTVTDLQEKMEKLELERDTLLRLRENADRMIGFRNGDTNSLKANELASLNNRIQDLETKLQQETLSKMSIEQNLNIEIESLKKSIENQRMLTRNACQEKTVLLQKINNLTQLAQNHNNILAQERDAKSELNSEYESLQIKHRKLLMERDKTESSQSKLRNQIEHLESEIQSLNKELTEVRTSHTSQLNQYMSNFSKQVKQLQSENEELVDSINSIENSYEQSITKLKKEKHKYKTIVSVAKKRIEDLSNETKSIKALHNSQLETKNTEMNNLKKQLHDMERQRDEVRFRLMMDHTNTLNRAIHETRSQPAQRAQSSNFDMLFDELKLESDKMANDFRKSQSVAKDQLVELQQLKKTETAEYNADQS